MTESRQKAWVELLRRYLWGRLRLLCRRHLALQVALEGCQELLDFGWSKDLEGTADPLSNLQVKSTVHRSTLVDSDIPKWEFRQPDGRCLMLQAHQPHATSRSLSPLYLGVMISVRLTCCWKSNQGHYPNSCLEESRVSMKKLVVFHHFPSAKCHDIAIIAKAGTDKFGRNLLSAGSRLSKLAGKEAQKQTVKRPNRKVVVRPVMLLSAARA